MKKKEMIFALIERRIYADPAAKRRKRWVAWARKQGLLTMKRFPTRRAAQMWLDTIEPDDGRKPVALAA